MLVQETLLAAEDVGAEGIRVDTVAVTAVLAAVVHPLLVAST
jgi:hypothetical protein